MSAETPLESSSDSHKQPLPRAGLDMRPSAVAERILDRMRASEADSPGQAEAEPSRVRASIGPRERRRLGILIGLFLGLGFLAAYVLWPTKLPRAPALDNSPVYQNNLEGFRFLAPDNYAQHASASVPAGKLDKERLIVRYRRMTPGKGAMLEVSVADLPESADLAQHLSGQSLGVKSWVLKGSTETVDVNGRSGTRLSFVGKQGKENMAKEVTAFRRGTRVYFFAAIYATDDAKARDQVRQAVRSLVWNG